LARVDAPLSQSFLVKFVILKAAIHSYPDEGTMWGSGLVLFRSGHESDMIEQIPPALDERPLRIVEDRASFLFTPARERTASTLRAQDSVPSDELGGKSPDTV
jgi:hypothetical protein